MANNNKNTQSRSFVEKVKNSINIIQLIEKSVALHHESGEWYAGATSSSSQSGSSLKVNSREQYYDNKATGDKGDVLNWIAYDQRLDIVKDFPTILKIACEEAGLPFEDLSNEDKEEAADTRSVHDALTQAAEIYHGNLTPELREFINRKWGISNETIDTLKIGYAKPGNGANLYGIIKDEILAKAGLINVVFEKGEDQMIVEHFQGRIVFPYWNSGKVVNFVARGAEKDKEGNVKHPEEQELLKTPTEYEKAKYKKLLVHSERHSYINKTVNNRYLLGEDSIRGKDFCVITEGVTDAIVLMQNGIPVLSPVTVQFSDKDHDKLIGAAKKLKTVYICNDNETSGAGEKGAVKTGLLLKREGVDVKIVTLPRPEGTSKIDIAEYFLHNDTHAFNVVLAGSNPIYTHILNKIKKSADAVENVKSASKFVDEIVKYLPKDEADMIINYDLKKKFDFTRDDCRIVKNYYTRVKEEARKDLTEAAIEEQFKIPFDVVATRIQERVYLFTLDDTKEIYMYTNGVYTKKGAETLIKKMAREVYSEIYCEMCTDAEFELPEHIPVPGISFCNEVLEQIRISTHVQREDIDNCPQYKYLVNMQNCIYNVETGECIEHSPKYKLVRQMPITYDPSADCPQIRKFLYDVVSTQDAQVLLEFLGYALIPDIKHDQAIMLLGSGSNGKSIWLKLIITMFGLENICSTSLQRLCEDKFAMAELYGKLLNIFPDLSDTMIQGDDAFKGLSSGDLLTAQQKYGQPFQFMNYARQIYSANDLPAVRKGNYAYFRRWILTTFPYIFVSNPNPENETEKLKDKELLGKLTKPEELSGLFNLAVACMGEMQKNGKYTYTDSVEDVSEKYQTSSDPIKVFTEKYTEPAEEDTPKTELYEYYKKWCLWKKIVPLTTQRFTKRLKSLGFSECRPYDDKSGKRGSSWEGVRLNEEYAMDVPSVPNEGKLNGKYETSKIMFWEKFRSEENPSELIYLSKNGQTLDRLQNVDFSITNATNDGDLDRVFPIPVVYCEKLAHKGTYAPELAVERRIGKKSVQNEPVCGSSYVKNRDQSLSKVCPNRVQIPADSQDIVKSSKDVFLPFVEQSEIQNQYTNAKQAILEAYNKKKGPITEVRVFVNEFITEFPEFPRDMVQTITGIFVQNGKIAVYGAKGRGC